MLKRIYKNGMVQTLLAGIGIISKEQKEFHKRSIVFQFKTKLGHNFTGYYSKGKETSPRGLVILLHGWEGSSQSSYILKTGLFLQKAGYSVFRLNFIDHGNTFRDNKTIFHGNLLVEHFEAIEWISSKFSPLAPVSMIGFSLGGNFALRLAMFNKGKKIPNLKHSIAISPALNPKKATVSMDQSKLLGRYFRKRWVNSLLNKESSFPDDYDFSKLSQYKTVMSVTDYVIGKSSDFRDTDHYFSGYIIDLDELVRCKTNCHLITSNDDPVIPIDDFYELQNKINEYNRSHSQASLTDLEVLSFGGHNGFFEDSFYEPIYLNRIQSILNKN
ncbi:alpha/beta fold hydrolase [Leptospira sp. GIMC2001]|uniref:alpha/beta fold hydrolase n=1 Tax=Leptospira sp. GIMC2001 TaxID=1513297 RepID=UPI00234ADDD5|nr:alpha/beta fold hydrolase [Leptospira sp. GIMC2001]WCL50463.1 alpha/beta fold hydrolase [Leptospira sp. GIMC2001]